MVVMQSSSWWPSTVFWLLIKVSDKDSRFNFLLIINFDTRKAASVVSLPLLMFNITVNSLIKQRHLALKRGAWPIKLPRSTPSLRSLCADPGSGPREKVGGWKKKRFATPVCFYKWRQSACVVAVKRIWIWSEDGEAWSAVDWSTLDGVCFFLQQTDAERGGRNLPVTNLGVRKKRRRGSAFFGNI